MENIVKLILVIALFLIVPRWIWRKRPKLKIGILNLQDKENPSFLENNFNKAIRICNDLYKSSLHETSDVIQLQVNDIFDYHYLYVEVPEEFDFSHKDRKELNEYIEGGGFIHFNIQNPNQLDIIKDIFHEYVWTEVEEAEFSFCWKKVIKNKNLDLSHPRFTVQGIKGEERWRAFLTCSDKKNNDKNFPYLLACYIIAALK